MTGPLRRAHQTATAIAHAAALLDPAVRGRGCGLRGLVERVGDLVFSVAVGLLFTVTSPAWGFVCAAALSGAAAVVLATERPGRSVDQRP
ncbi:MAG: hypothetical protein ACHQE5_10295 [Actinomycetes bacterium]